MKVRTVASVPTVAEGEPAGRVPAGPGAEVGGPLRRAALGVLAAERRTPRLAPALGLARLQVVHVGTLNAAGRPIGATIVAELVPPRRNVKATVPAFIPGDPGASEPYALQEVRMHASLLRDALIDLDLRTRRVIAVEPGPGSRNASWRPSKEPAPAGAANEE